MSVLDKLTPGGFTPASVIDELRAEFGQLDALRQALADVWAIARHHVVHHTLGGEVLARRVTELLAGMKRTGPSDVFRICDAYESGLGHGLKCDGTANPYAHAAEREAYDIGYRQGQEHREQVRTDLRIVPQ